MNLFEKIFFTVLIIVGVMFTIGCLFTLLSNGEIWLPILIYPTAVFIILMVLYLIVYIVFQIWGISIPFFEMKILNQS